jgi:hypothetical protein
MGNSELHSYARIISNPHLSLDMYSTIVKKEELKGSSKLEVDNSYECTEE